MFQRWRAWLGLLLCGPGVGCASASRGPQSALAANLAPSATFEVDGAPLCFVGTNNYYLSYKPRPVVDGVLEAAQAMGAKVLRVWAFIDRGSLDGSSPSIDGEGSKEGQYFQAWDPAQHRAVYNDGPSGLQSLDYALAKAAQLHLKLVLVLTNNWHEFGGMDQYLAWYGLTSHQAFYTDLAVKQAYRAWLSHLVTHVNSLTQRAYKDDPTIFAWELANEPRGGAGTESSVLNAWAGEMSSYLKSLDPEHLVAVGDEGFFEQSNPSSHWTYRANNGVDHPALSALPDIDYATFHMYPDTWGTGFGWPERWIDDHLRVARALGKPTVLEEYGLKLSRDALGHETDGLDVRLNAYSAWNERILSHGGSAAMFWLLVAKDEGGGLYPDYDHFSVYPGDRSSDLLRGFAQRFASQAPACLSAVSSTARAASPFVRVRHRALTAFGWLPNDG
jgi:mannan endo-1,4-beta-mannosidase